LSTKGPSRIVVAVDCFSSFAILDSQIKTAPQGR
jgi:hypothetical protein